MSRLVYVLSQEDIIISKLGRLSESDVSDIDTMLAGADRGLLKQLIHEVLRRRDLSEKAKGVFKKMLNS